MAEYPIGSVVYIVRGGGCFPALVTEEHIAKSQEGVKKKYILVVPGGKKIDVVPEEEDIFTTIEDVRSALLSQAELSIGSHLRRVRELASELAPAHEVHSIDAEDTATDDETIALVELPDGTTARLKQGKMHT